MLLRALDEQAAVADNSHIGQIRTGRFKRRNARVHVHRAALVGVMHHGDDERIAQLRCAGNDVHMADGHRVKAARA